MKSKLVLFDNRPAQFPNGTFRPTGRLVQVGSYPPNPLKDRKRKPLWSARLLVGLNVGKKPKWTIEDIIPVVQEVRLAQVGDAGASLLLQYGIYTWTDEKGRRQTTDEKSAQVIVINYVGVAEKKFEQQMVELGEELARRFKQQVVPIEVQRNGIVQWSGMIVPA
jgi:hypothetical protein